MLLSDVRNLLPIGTVVRLKGAEKNLMIFGMRQTDSNENKEYDYIGVMYPEGNLGEELRFMFNHEDIEETVFLGYDSDERKELLEKLHEFFSQK